MSHQKLNYHLLYYPTHSSLLLVTLQKVKRALRAEVLELDNQIGVLCIEGIHHLIHEWLAVMEDSGE